jgi:hypothetical protein
VPSMLAKIQGAVPCHVTIPPEVMRRIEAIAREYDWSLNKTLVGLLDLVTRLDASPQRPVVREKLVQLLAERPSATTNHHFVTKRHAP